jgi:hypothetical protein
MYMHRLLILPALLAAGLAARPHRAAPPELAREAGCYLVNRVETLRREVAAGRAPLLVVNDTPTGPLRDEGEGCQGVRWRELQVGQVRMLRPSAAEDLYGPGARNGAVIVDVLPPRR